MTSKGHGVIRGHRDLLYDHKGQHDLWSWSKGQAFDLTGDHRCQGNTIRQSRRSILPEHVMTSCSLIFLVMLTMTLHIVTKQSMFVKHVSPLWAYFIEATKLKGKHFKSLNSCNIFRTWSISPHALLDLWCNIPAKFHSSPCKDVGGVEKTS